jgi:hypothetical protein
MLTDRAFAKQLMPYLSQQSDRLPANKNRGKWPASTNAAGGLTIICNHSSSLSLIESAQGF